MFCTVLNSSYDVDVCSCDEQISVFDECVSEYPCLKVFVSYVLVAPSTTLDATSWFQNTSWPLMTDDQPAAPRRRRSSAASVDDRSDVKQLGLVAELGDAEDHSAAAAHTRRFNASVYDEAVGPAFTAKTAVSQHQTTADRQPSIDRLTGNGSEPMTSYEVETDKRRASATDSSGDLTATTAAAANRSYVAQLYRSWDDSFLPQVCVKLLHFFRTYTYV